MKKTFLFLALALSVGTVSAQQTNTNSASHAGSDAGAMAQTGSITFEASEPRSHTRISTTPNVYAPPSMFGGANNCGQSDSMALSVTGFGIGGSHASESKNCNAREDTSIAYKLGYKDVADMRFFCFGTDDNRMSWEATGRKCPDTATAKGLPNVPTSATRNHAASGGYSGNDPVVMRRMGAAN